MRVTTPSRQCSQRHLNRRLEARQHALRSGGRQKHVAGESALTDLPSSPGIDQRTGGPEAKWVCGGPAGGVSEAWLDGWVADTAGKGKEEARSVGWGRSLVGVVPEEKETQSSKSKREVRSRDVLGLDRLHEVARR